MQFAIYHPLQDLLCITGSIDTNRGDIEGYNGFKNALLSAKQHNLEHEVLTGDQVNERFPGYNLPSNFMVGWSTNQAYHESQFAAFTKTMATHISGHTQFAAAKPPKCLVRNPSRSLAVVVLRALCCMSGLHSDSSAVAGLLAVTLLTSLGAALQSMNFSKLLAAARVYAFTHSSCMALAILPTQKMFKRPVASLVYGR